MPRPTPRTRDRKEVELHPKFREFFLDEIDARQLLDVLKPPGPAFEYSDIYWKAQFLFWPRPSAGCRIDEVWGQHRDSLLEEYIRLHPGTRPRSWWQFDNTHGRPGPDESETAFLKRHGLLTADEMEFCK
jgi:hypothetical protein